MLRRGGPEIISGRCPLDYRRTEEEKDYVKAAWHNCDASECNLYDPADKDGSSKSSSDIAVASILSTVTYGECRQPPRATSPCNPEAQLLGAEAYGIQ